MSQHSEFGSQKPEDSSQKERVLSPSFLTPDSSPLTLHPLLLPHHFARFILRQAGEASDVLRICASLLCVAVENGHICLNLAELAGREVVFEKEKITLPKIAELKQILLEKKVVGTPGEFCPLILDEQGRLYLHRYWQYERQLADIILEKSSMTCPLPDGETLCRDLDRLFPDVPSSEPDWQKTAALAALWKKFVMISGGPGVGKTSTVIKILALLLMRERRGALRIALAAPTGKAAMRLAESIRQMKEKLACPEEVKSRIPEEIFTLHRLLGGVAGSTRFRHSAKNPLGYDVVMVDEASMVSLPLMFRLAVALKKEARLILIGDRHQLASVEAGAVLGDLCGGGRREIYSQKFQELCSTYAGGPQPVATSFERPGPLTDALIILSKNYRFSEKSGIAAAAKAVNEGKGKDALAICQSQSFADMVWKDMSGLASLNKALTQASLKGYQPYLTVANPEEALKLFESFRILCAVRQGPYGVTGLNEQIEKILAAQGLISPAERWYRGRPVMITVNDYSLRLFNGDIGLIWPDPTQQGKLFVFFQSSGGIRKIAPARLPAHETVYAMTVHKSQGSEFDRLALILPREDSPVLTRELIYTGLTRAKKQVEIWGKEEIFVNAVLRRIERQSGLQEALWKSSTYS